MPGVLRKGTRLGKYRLERRLGKGAFSDVWSARDTVEGRRVALKIAFDWVVREFGREAMEAEARIARERALLAEARARYEAVDAASLAAHADWVVEQVLRMASEGSP